MDLNGQDLLKVLNDVDMEMLEEAENYTSSTRKRKNRFAYFSIAAAACVVVIICGIKGMSFGEKEVTYEMQYIKLDDTHILARPVENETQGGYIKEEALSEDNSLEDTLIQLQLSEGIYEDYLVPQVGIGTNGSTLLKKAIREQHKKNSEKEVAYLVEIEVFVPHKEYSELGDYADNQVYEAEYLRLTKECGLDLTWIAPGGYEIPDAYVYCLSKGIMYGALTEEQMENFPMNEKYSYGFRLTAHDSYRFAEYPYKETYTDTELFRSQLEALRALDELGEKKEDEEN